jgi:hypothetical protein
MEDTSQFSDAATGDLVEHLAMSERDPLAELGIVGRNMPPQRVRDGGHRREEPGRYFFRWKIVSMTFRVSTSAVSVRCR